MKTLVIMGSARKHGHTGQMTELFLETLGGEYEMIDAYEEKNISPCRDCRYCWKKKECIIKDDMQEIYRKIEEADNLLLVSPVYFHSISGPMKILIDRLQIYWAAAMRKEMPDHFLRKGAILMAGGAPEFPDQFLGAQIVLKNVLHELSAELIGQVCFSNTDHDSLETRPDIVQQIREVALKMKQQGDC